MKDLNNLSTYHNIRSGGKQVMSAMIQQEPSMAVFGTCILRVVALPSHDTEDAETFQCAVLSVLNI